MARMLYAWEKHVTWLQQSNFIWNSEYLPDRITKALHKIQWYVTAAEVNTAFIMFAFSDIYSLGYITEFCIVKLCKNL